jgi:hypothetical protein
MYSRLAHGPYRPTGALAPAITSSSSWWTTSNAARRPRTISWHDGAAAPVWPSQFGEDLS